MVSPPLAGVPSGSVVSVMLTNQGETGAGVLVAATASPGTLISTISIPGTGQHYGIVEWDIVLGLQNGAAAVSLLTIVLEIVQNGVTQDVNDVGTSPNIVLGATGTGGALQILRPYAFVIADGEGQGAGFLDTSQPLTMNLRAFSATANQTTIIPFGRSRVYGWVSGAI